MMRLLPTPNPSLNPRAQLRRRRKMMLLPPEKNSNKCKPKWTPLLPKLIRRELSNKPNTKTTLAKETQLLNCKAL